MCYVVGISPPSKVKKFLLLFCLRRGKGAEFLLCFLPPVPEKEILDFIAHSSIIRVFTVLEGVSKRLCTSVFGSPSYRATIEGDFRGMAAVPT